MTFQELKNQNQASAAETARRIDLVEEVLKEVGFAEIIEGIDLGEHDFIGLKTRVEIRKKMSGMELDTSVERRKIEEAISHLEEGIALSAPSRTVKISLSGRDCPTSRKIQAALRVLKGIRYVKWERENA